MENIESTTTNNDKDNIKIKPADSQENKNPKENQTQYKVINVDNIDGSTFKTKRKSFISEINPHLVRRTIQKEQYVWFGVYDDLLRKKCIIKAIKKCKDASLPLVTNFLNQIHFNFIKNFYILKIFSSIRNALRFIWKIIK